MKRTQILLTFILISLAGVQSLQESREIVIAEAPTEIEQTAPILLRSNALKDPQLSLIMAALNEDKSENGSLKEQSQKNVAQTDSEDATSAQLGFFDGLIIGLQVHSEAESACLVAYRYHRDVVNTAFANLFSFNRSIFFEALLNLVKLTSNLNQLMEDCQVQNLIYFTANTLTIPGFASLVTRLARNTVLLTEILTTVDFNRTYSVGLFLGTFVSVLVGFSLP